MAGQIFMDYREIIRLLGGILIIIFALFIIDVIKIPFLNFETRFHLKSKPAGYFGSFVAGIVFSAGWTPCVGPILGSILVLASHEGSVYRGMILLGSYSLGLGIPFFITSLSVNSFLAYYKKLNKYIRYINIAAGLFLLAVGIMLLVSVASSFFVKFI
jgi:cytochrome c-type biogenesis protein